jgi:hypothetical protein
MRYQKHLLLPWMLEMNEWGSPEVQADHATELGCSQNRAFCINSIVVLKTITVYSGRIKCKAESQGCLPVNANPCSVLKRVKFGRDSDVYSDHVGDNQMRVGGK